MDGTDPSGGKYGYKIFSFHDFYLLRTHNSLAGATHIKPEYEIRNLVFNGPTIDQDKKMVTRLLHFDNPDKVTEVEEIW